MTNSKVYEEPLQEEWLDPYGHLNEGYFLVPFGNANWYFCEQLEIGVKYFERTGCAFYTVESHLRYLKDVRAPALLQLEQMVFGVDTKRVHFGLVMTVDGIERATMESMMLHIDTNAGRTVSMSDDVKVRLREATVAEIPSWVGQSISPCRQ